MNRIVFLHIPKTAGTTVSRFFLRRLPRRRVLIGGSPRVATETARSPGPLYYSGHLGWDAFAGLDFAHQSFTFLRDPRARLISTHAFLRGARLREDAAPGPTALAARRMGLGDWLKFCLDGADPASPHVNSSDNMYVRVLLGPGGVAAAPRLELDPDGPEMHLARQRLRQLDCVGIVEDFDAALTMIAGAMGLPPPTEADLVPANRSDSGPRAETERITDAMEEMIAELTCLDRRIYDYGRMLYAEQRRAHGMA